ncbi:hypothetical protein D3C73_687630 [compost metagenome]
MRPLLDLGPGPFHFLQILMVIGHQAPAADEQVQFSRIQRICVQGVDNQELHILVVVHLRPLQHMKTIFNRQRMEMEEGLQQRGFLWGRLIEVGPHPGIFRIIQLLQRDILLDLMFMRNAKCTYHCMRSLYLLCLFRCSRRPDFRDLQARKKPTSSVGSHYRIRAVIRTNPSTQPNSILDK